MEEQFERWKLLDLIIDAGSQTVVRDDDTIVLPKLSFQFLLELIRAAPNVLTVDDLMERVWPGIFVNSETVTQRAKLLRDALRDDPKEPRYFAVRRGIGYQLIAKPVRLEHEIALARDAKWRGRKGLSMAIAAGLAVAGLGGGLVAYRHTAEAALQAPLRVAVLPFDNLSADPADAFIAQGIPEMVINRLSTIPGLMVISRESALLSKAATASPAQAGKQLDAEYVVKGSVQKAGAMLRVTSFVIDTDTGARLWSQSFDWPVDKLYALQDRIAEQVARSLTSRISATRAVPLAPSRATNPDAYLAYLKGRALLGRLRVADTEAAAAQFQRAADLDPGFAPALVALYDARMQAASLKSEDLEPLRLRYQPLLDRALALDPDSGPALFARAMWSNLPREERVALFERAARKDPSNSRGLVAYAQLLEWGRRDSDPTEKSQQLMDRVMAIDPLSADAQFWNVQRSVFLLRPPKETEAAQRRALELDPDNILLANRYAVRRWRMNGETAQAIGLMERILGTDPQYARSAHVAFVMYLDVGDLAAAREVAASTPASRDSSRAVLAAYTGDWRQAGEAALGPRGFVFNQQENWLWPEVVRDYGVKTGQLDRAAQAIATRYGFDLSNPRVTTLHQMSNAAPLASILLAQGKRDLAVRVLTGIVRWVDDHPQMGLVGGTGRAKASALMLLGQKDLALSVLLATTSSAHDIHLWWYLVDQDPIWMPVHGDPRFRAIAELCRQSAKVQRTRLEELRRARQVPARPASRGT